MQFYVLYENGTPGILLSFKKKKKASKTIGLTKLSLNCQIFITLITGVLPEMSISFYRNPVLFFNPYSEQEVFTRALP